MDQSLIGSCGVDCAACDDFHTDKCPSCRESEWPAGDACPPVACCRERDIDSCGRCRDFPCTMMRDFYGESDSHRQAGERMRALHDAAGSPPTPWEKRTSADYRISRWSGGSTTELAIAPAGARYADRDFLWRVSSATVELEESEFTPLPDYERWISTLEGEIVLRHDLGPEIPLRPLQVHRFDGGAATRSRGRCRDFNLMLRKGRAEGTMEALRPGDAPLALPAGEAGETRLLFCAAGRCIVRGAGAEIALAAGESLLAAGDLPLTLRDEETGTVLMLCQIRETE